ncbi:MAG: phosphotransferase [Myxococcota bacterium]
MIAGLETGLQRVGAASPALGAALERLLGRPGERLRFDGLETLRRAQVHRVRFRAEGEPLARALVIKRLSLDRSHREQRALRCWLPNVGLEAHGAPLLEVVAAADGACVWHVYEDLGAGSLDALGDRLGAEGRAALALVATLHLRFVAHPLLADCRTAGVDLGPGFFAASTGDALRSLAALRGSPGLPESWGAPIDRLLERLVRLEGEADQRARESRDLGWPETLLHGDPWLSNFVATSREGRPHLHLIDWERAGVGPAIYDLSTFLRQLAPVDRTEAIAQYRSHVEPAGWPWPERPVLERLSEACELGRFASFLQWRVLPVLDGLDRDGPPPWLLDDLVEIERWFAERTPLLPADRSAA